MLFAVRCYYTVRRAHNEEREQATLNLAPRASRAALLSAAVMPAASQLIRKATRDKSREGCFFFFYQRDYGALINYCSWPVVLCLR